MSGRRSAGSICRRTSGRNVATSLTTDLGSRGTGSDSGQGRPCGVRGLGAGYRHLSRADHAGRVASGSGGAGCRGGGAASCVVVVARTVRGRTMRQGCTAACSGHRARSGARFAARADSVARACCRAHAGSAARVAGSPACAQATADVRATATAPAACRTWCAPARARRDRASAGCMRGHRADCCVAVGCSSAQVDCSGGMRRSADSHEKRTRGWVAVCTEPRTIRQPPPCYVRSVGVVLGRWPFRRCSPVAEYPPALRSCIWTVVPARCMPFRTTAASRKRASRANRATRYYHHRCCHLEAAAAASSCATASPASPGVT